MKPILWMTLAATLGATLLMTTQESSEVEPTVRSGNRASPSPTSAKGASVAVVRASSTDAARMEKLSQALNDWLAYRQAAQAKPAGTHAVVASGDMASWASQQPPPPPPPPPYIPPPPPPPMAPPFTHAWVGRYVDTEPRAVIAGASQTWVVKVGDVVDSQWRVDAIAERQMTLTYLPLKQTQTVSMK